MRFGSIGCSKLAQQLVGTPGKYECWGAHVNIPSSTLEQMHNFSSHQGLFHEAGYIALATSSDEKLEREICQIASEAPFAQTWNPPIVALATRRARGPHLDKAGLSFPCRCVSVL